MGTPRNPISMLDSSSVIEWCTKCVPHAANVTNAVDNAAHAFASDANTNLGFQITAVLAVFLGFLLCFFGWSLFHITLCLTGALIGLGAGFAFFCGATSSLVAASIHSVEIGGRPCLWGGERDTSMPLPHPISVISASSHPRAGWDETQQCYNKTP